MAIVTTPLGDRHAGLPRARDEILRMMETAFRFRAFSVRAFSVRIGSGRSRYRPPVRETISAGRAAMSASTREVRIHE
jgi:hypothetical protein